MAIVMLYLSPFARYSTEIVQFQDLDLGNEGQDQGADKRNLHDSTDNVQFHMGEFSSEFSNLGTYVYAKGHTQRET